MSHNTTTKTIITCFLSCMMMSTVFAADVTCTQTDITCQLAQITERMLNILSRLWIPLAIFAGKLMGNGFIYGEFINLDKVLYFIWNLSRTFANFLIVALIVWEVIKQFKDGGFE